MAGCEVRIELERRFVKDFVLQAGSVGPQFRGKIAPTRGVLARIKIAGQHRISLLEGSVELGRMGDGDSIG